MARGVNKVVLIGNLGQDPETRYMPSGGAVTNVTLATSETWKDKTTGQPQERTEWHRLVFFNRLAEIAGEYLKKGAKIYAEGSLRTRKWTDQQQVERHTTEIVVSEMQMLDSRNPNQQAPQQNRQPTEPHQGQYHGEPASPPHQYQQPAQQQPAPGYAAGGPAPSGGFDDFDDDINF